jgi:glyoxylase-like metal-dependent hydrolase (beta-lactamase superfamily II)
MSMPQFQKELDRQVESSPSAALPVVTFAEGVTFHWNGDQIDVFHAPNAHTDGDVLIRFVESNVIHMGDTYFSNAFPFIDLSSGGSYKGLMAAVDRTLELADDETKIIPGHGPLSDKKGLLAYREMLGTVHGRVGAMLAEGKTQQEVIDARPSREWDETRGQGGFMPTVRWLGIVYQSIAAEKR